LGFTGTGFSVSIVPGNGDGTFQKPRTITRTANICGGGIPILVSDFNGDGKLDIAFCTDTSIGILLGNGNGTFQKPVFYGVYFGGPGNGSFSFAAGDFNSDGKTDLIVSHIGLNTQFSILFGNGDGTFQPKSVIELPPGDSGEAGIVTGDFNADGLLDFAFQYGGYGIGVYPQK
jgi:FG-GAP-like repeat